MGERTSRVDLRGWLNDPWLWVALCVGLAVRVVPLAIWPQVECIRDECIYRAIAAAIVDGKGLVVANKGWLPAPGYPYLLAWSKELFGSMQPVKGFQVALSFFSIPMMLAIGRIVADRRAGRIAAMLFALNPTIAWFTNTQWIETVYIFLLLAASLAVLVAQRTRGVSVAWRYAALGGVALGGAVLFRGIATYLPPLFILALCWPEPSQGGEEVDRMDVNTWVASAKLRWRSVVAFLLAAFLTVAPYSIHASGRHGGFMVSDATVGHVLFLGNNDFPPLTFDYGNGMLTQPLFSRYLRTGRRPCRRDRPPVRSSKCEVQQALAWAKTHPDKFVARIPMRLAQILNPNSFLTRHVRWGFFPGLPWWAKEGLTVLIVVWSMATVLLGTAAAWARARGPWAWIAIGTTLYTLAITAMMYGMSRFRLPLEALWTVYLAMFLADPRGTIQTLSEQPVRLAGALVTLPPLFALMLWYLPTGFPLFWR
ncbi:MAG: glycosyltransferase family 39 protein [Myxococcales bacterium]|nr:glycosyltransferase family 39 protein [Myxococcales bacterium]